MVASFAKMQPNFLLRQTMLAAGDPRLSAWYSKLCLEGKELIEVEDVRVISNYPKKTLTVCYKLLQAATASRDINKAAVETIEPDMLNYEARQRNEFEVSLLKLRKTQKKTKFSLQAEVLEVLVGMHECKDIKKKREVVIKEKKELKDKMSRIQDERKPLMDLQM